MSGSGPPDLSLYVGSNWESPWVFHALAAIEEKQLPYKLEVVPMPFPSGTSAMFKENAIIAKVPILVHGDTWISESLAISEYLAEAFPAPAHPRLFPSSVTERARARQIMLLLRTSMFALREVRPTSTMFGKPVNKPMTDQAKAEAAELVRIALAVIPEGKTTMFADWCIADCDLGLALMRLVAHQDPLDRRLVDYALAQFDRRSSQRFISHLPTSR